MNKGVLMAFTCLAIGALSGLAFFVGGQTDSPVPKPVQPGRQAPRVSAYQSSDGLVAVLWLSPEVRGGVYWSKDEKLQYKLMINDPRNKSKTLDLEQIVEIEVPYEVQTVEAGLGPHAFVVHGKTQDGLQVLEKFQFTPAVGAYKFESVLPLGSIRSSIQGGGPFLPPEARLPMEPPVRTLLYLNPALGANLIVINESKGRFTYVVSLDQNLFTKIPWALGESPASIPLGKNQELLSLVDVGRMYTHGSEGEQLRLWLKDSATGRITGYLLCSEMNSAGIFESTEYLSKDQFKAAGYPGLWVDDHVSHISWLPIY